MICIVKPLSRKEQRRKGYYVTGFATRKTKAFSTQKNAGQKPADMRVTKSPIVRLNQPEVYLLSEKDLSIPITLGNFRDKHRHCFVRWP
jgi:hypothetical protein